MSNSMNPQDVSQSLHGIAVLEWGLSREVQLALQPTVVRTSKLMNVQDVSTCIYALAKLDFVLTSELQDALHTALLRTASAMAPIDLSLVTWALAVLEWPPSDLLLARITEQLARLPLSEFPSAYLTQLYQAYLAFEFAPGPLRLPTAMHQRAEEEWHRIRSETTTSHFQHEVATCLQRLGLEYCIEYLTADNNFSIDIALVHERIAIEVDGPHHFYDNHEPLATTRFRDRLLSARGWRVVCVAHNKWGELSTPSMPRSVAAKAEERFMRDLLSQVLPQEHRTPPTHSAVDTVASLQHLPPARPLVAPEMFRSIFFLIPGGFGDYGSAEVARMRLAISSATCVDERRVLVQLLHCGRSVLLQWTSTTCTAMDLYKSVRAQRLTSLGGIPILGCMPDALDAAKFFDGQDVPRITEFQKEFRCPALPRSLADISNNLERGRHRLC